MASDLSIVEYVVDQMSGAGEITFKRMFGEFGVYCDGKIIGSVCDNKLFVKQTEAGRAYIKDLKEASPYPGAKPQLWIDDMIEDGEWLSELIRLTADELPEPKPKRKRKPKPKGQ